MIVSIRPQPAAPWEMTRPAVSRTSAYCDCAEAKERCRKRTHVLLRQLQASEEGTLVVVSHSNYLKMLIAEHLLELEAAADTPPSASDERAHDQSISRALR